MPRRTMQARLVEALMRLRGAEPAPGHRSTRYVALKREGGGFYYVGKAGALRIGDSVAQSRPLPDEFKRQLLAETEGADNARERSQRS